MGIIRTQKMISSLTTKIDASKSALLSHNISDIISRIM